MKLNDWLPMRNVRLKPRHSIRLVIAAGIVACVHAALWTLDRGVSAAPDIRGPLASFSYTRLQGAGAGGRVTAAQIRSDLKAHAPHTRAVRTYASTGAPWETALGGMLVTGATIVSATNYDQVRENYFFAAALLVQSVPFLSAAAIATLERARPARSR